MRLLSFFLLASLCTGAYALDPAPVPPPPPLDSAPPPLPPPSANSDEAVDEPQVTITKQSEQTIEEYRVGGRLFMIKVTPTVGPTYYLVDETGDGKFTRRDSLDGGIRPPRWILFRF
jgi:hypothetical protein